MPFPYYSIIVPAFNEAERIGASLERMIAYIAESRWSAEIIVVNDGSSDNTASVVQQYASRNPIIRILDNPGNRGKGYSVRNGMTNASGQVLLFTDADLSSPIEEATKLFTVIEKLSIESMLSSYVSLLMSKSRSRGSPTPSIFTSKRGT